MKIIPKINLIDQLEGRLENYASDISFSILSPNNNYLTAKETNNLYKQNTSIAIIDLVAFTPQRVLSHEIIISLTTTIKMKDLDQDLFKKFKFIQSFINVENFYKECNLARQEILSIHELKMANQLTNEIFKKKAKELIAQAILKSSLVQLTNHPLDKRVTITINGPIASGKGVFKSTLMHLDTIKINGDSYKTLLNPEYILESSPIKIALFSQLVQEEIHYLSREINKRLVEKIETTNSAPNVYLDKSLMNQNDIEIATLKNGEIKGFLISLPIEESIKRSETRGNQTGRYEDTYEILLAHNSITGRLTNLLLENVGKSIIYTIYDNNIRSLEAPIKTAEINLKLKKITLYNKDKFIELLSKSNLDIERSIEQEEIAYTHENNLNSSYYLDQIYLAGYSIDSYSSIC
jgi:hypothetical protein